MCKKDKERRSKSEEMNSYIGPEARYLTKSTVNPVQTQQFRDNSSC